MVYLLLSILLNTLLFVIFKYFSRFNVNNLHAIVINYFIAFFTGFMFDETIVSLSQIPKAPWFKGTLFLGVLFVTLFNILALTAQKIGLSVVSIASKMSVVIPVVFAFIVYEDKITFFKVIGIILALMAVYLVTKKTTHTLVKNKYLYLPLLLFIGSGLLDTILKYVEFKYVSIEETNIYSAVIFLVAGITGTVIILIQTILKKVNFEIKSVIAGIVLGLPNFFSIYFLLKALKIDGIESSYVFPVNNVGVVLLSTVVGIGLFKEKLSNLNKIGIVIAIGGIVLMSIAS
ncbi:EamA family transporter [Ascidiimonas sp. W6]|uniref:EamA family transporter n=1 Tax=Ascidiimonas meishanensis TaxID=3128903 RepID=UPI0030EDC77E